jgi:hypothetical protein
MVGYINSVKFAFRWHLVISNFIITFVLVQVFVLSFPVIETYSYSGHSVYALCKCHKNIAVAGFGKIKGEEKIQKGRGKNQQQQVS